MQWLPCLELTSHVAKFDDTDLDSVPAIRQRPHVAWSNDVHIIGRNVFSCMKLFMHLLTEGLPSTPAYEIRGYDQPRIAQQLVLHGRVIRHPKKMT